MSVGQRSIKKSEFLWHTLSVNGEMTRMSLSLLFERRKRNTSLLTLEKYLNFIEAHPNLFKHIESPKLIKTIGLDKKLIEENSYSINKLMKYRDNVGAHLDKSFIGNMKSFNEETSLEPHEFESLFLLAFRIIEKYSFFFEGKHIKKEMYEADIDENELLNFVRIFIQK